MKKAFSFLFLFILLVNLSFAQDIDDSEVSGEFLQQYQTFSWNRVAKAKKYEITIEKQLENGDWEPAVSNQTSDSRIELLLYPGNYRVAISVFNALGRKTSTTDWTPFIILNETQPYLYADALKKSVTWQSPLLTVKQEGTTTVEEVDDEGSVSAREGDPTNSIFVKGRNIFFPTTTFSLVPKVQGTEGRQFEAFVDLREEVPLEIVRRDTENSGVVLSYDSKKLFSGYYDVVVKNPGGQTAQLELLVFANEIPSIDTTKFGYNKNYKVNTITLNKTGETTLTIQGKGFGNNTLFTLKPDEGFIPYPFTSTYERNELKLELTSHKCLDKEGTVSVTFKYPGNELFTGYYKLTADNGNSKDDSVLLLVDATSPKNLAPEVTKLKSKPAKASGLITYQVTGTGINENTKFSLISAYSEEDDSNKRFEVSYVMAKRNGTLHILSGDGKGLTAGRYALLMENENSSEILFVDVNEKQKFEICQVSEAEKENLFFRPVSKAEITKVNIEERFDYSPLDFKFKEVLPVFMSSVDITGGLFNGIVKSRDSEFDVQFCVLNFNWFRWDLGINYFDAKGWGVTGSQIGTDIAFEIPGKVLRPYAGAGYYKAITSSSIPVGATFLRNDSIPVFAGIKLGNFIDIRYTLSFENVQNEQKNWFVTDKYSIGANIPLHAYKYEKKVKTTTANIIQSDMIDGTQYKLQGNTRALYLDSPVIVGFNDNAKIKSVKFGNHVQEIGMKAFANCSALEKVELNYGLLTIKNGAFENTPNLTSLEIPSTVTTVEKGALEGFGKNCAIILKWSSDDETPRNLEGLTELDSLIFYSDGVLFNGDNESLAIYTAIAWRAEAGENNSLFATFNLEKNKDNQYATALKVSGNIHVMDAHYTSPVLYIDTDEVKNLSNKKSGVAISSIKLNFNGYGNVYTRLILTDAEEKEILNYSLELNKYNEFTIPEEYADKIEGMKLQINRTGTYINEVIPFEFKITDFEIK